MQKTKIIRTATVAISLDYLLKGQLAFLNKHYEVVAVSGSDAHLVNVKDREGVRTVNLPMQRAISPLQDLVSLWKLFWLFKKVKPQIVHSITPKAGLLSMTAAYFAGVPIRIHTFTGLIFPSKTGKLKQLLIIMDKVLCYFATHIFPEGNGVKKDLINYKITDKPLKVLANGNVNGIDVDFFSPDQVSISEKMNLRKQLEILDTDFVFIFIGRMVGDKGINELATAFDQLSKEKSSVKLILVGPQEPDLDPLQDTTLGILKNNKAIKAVGFQEQVRNYYAISDALVFPSYREGFPNVVLQAGAMGLPCIVTDISGSNEIIIEGKNGTIIPVKDTKAIYVAMSKIISDSAYRMQLQQNARPMIVSRYEQKVVWEAILAEYKKIEKGV